jgi:hypothetical protein
MVEKRPPRRRKPRVRIAPARTWPRAPGRHSTISTPLMRCRMETSPRRRRARRGARTAAGVGVDHEHRALEGVEQHVVGGLRADAVHGEQACAQGTGLQRREAGLAAGLQQLGAEGLQALGLDVEVAHRPQQLSQLLLAADRSAPRRCRGTRSVSRARAFSTLVQAVFWVRIGADHDLERGVGRPPVLRAVGSSRASNTGEATSAAHAAPGVRTAPEDRSELRPLPLGTTTTPSGETSKRARSAAGRSRCAHRGR